MKGGEMAVGGKSLFRPPLFLDLDVTLTRSTYHANVHCSFLSQQTSTSVFRVSTFPPLSRPHVYTPRLLYLQRATPHSNKLSSITLWRFQFTVFRRPTGGVRVPCCDINVIKSLLSDLAHDPSVHLVSMSSSLVDTARDRASMIVSHVCAKTNVLTEYTAVILGKYICHSNGRSVRLSDIPCQKP
ncbi:hypothetical protein CPB85DRAFT_952984 [Mucidula mucida]|nr:hypothetical protein CPB85DRAFT_952984 [Mucidula mucida]